MSDFDVTIDPNLDAYVMKLVGVVDACYDAAVKIADQAREDAPVDTGDYQSQISAQKSENGARVYSGSNKSAWIEFGVPHHELFGGEELPLPAQFILRNAAVKQGYKFGKPHA